MRRFLESTAALKAFVTENAFWIVCLCLSSFCVTVWVIASYEIDTKNSRQTAEIENSFQTGENIIDISVAPHPSSVHPNLATESDMLRTIERTKTSVLRAWAQRRASQEQALQPSQEVVSKNESFVEYFSKYSPPETIPADSKIPQSLLKMYQQNIPEIMPRLCQIIGTNWNFSEIDNDETNGDSLKPEVCIWAEKNQKLWHAKLTDFRNRDDNDNVNFPSPSQVVMLEQDLRLLESMFRVVRLTNSMNGKTINANDFANIKQIDYVVFGREAYAKLGKIHEIATQPKSDPRRRFGRTTENEIDFENKPAFHARYIDHNGEYLTSSFVKNLFGDGQGLTETNLDLLIAKKVPVRIAMLVDERHIGAFIAACENSVLPFHITQTRVNVHDPNEEFTLKGKSGKQTAQSRKRRMDPGVAGVGDDNKPDSKKRRFGPVESRTSYDVNVEFYGYAKIFNPVNEQRLK